MYVNSFRELQKIYEDYRGMSFNPSPNIGNTADPSKYSYRGSLPFNAGGSDNAYARNALNTGITITPAEDEDEPIQGPISKKTVLDKINDLMTLAKDDEMMYAVHTLGQLKEFIKQL